MHAGPYGADEQGGRVRRFLDVYGADPATAADAIRLVPVRLTALVDFMVSQARAGNPVYAHHIEQGHVALYRRDIAYTTRNQMMWQGKG